MELRPICFSLAVLIISSPALRSQSADDAPPTVLKSQHFDRDPGWEASNNRVVPKSYPTINQDFGFSRTNFAGNGPGELGGLVTRAFEPAFYAAKIGPQTLNDKLTASGSFAITKTTPGGGVFFGFFRAEQPGGGGRPTSSLGMHFDSEHSGARLAVRLITGKNQSCGTFTTPFIPGKFRPTPIRNDAARYAWTLDYDPQAAGGNGRFVFTLHGERPKPEEVLTADLPASHREEALKRFPVTTTFSVDLPPGYREQGATFDHFGLMNMTKPGGQTSIYFDDLRYNDRAEDFARDPEWYGQGNRARYQAKDVGGAHNFGFSNSSHAGGQPGEIGGVFWRSDHWGYYADKVGRLTFDQRLEARGKVIMVAGGPDADMCFGWFHGETAGAAPDKGGTFLGIKVGGPTRVGHYFLPQFAVNEQVRQHLDKGPVIEPGKQLKWSLVYDPSASGGNGSITATLGAESVTLDLKPGQRAKAKASIFDHFGMFSIGPGGQIVRLYLDDLTYTASSSTR